MFETLNASFSTSNDIDFWFRTNHMIEKWYSKIEKANFWKCKKWSWNRVSEDIRKFISYENQIASCRVENPVVWCPQMWERKSEFFFSGAFRGRTNNKLKNTIFSEFCKPFLEFIYNINRKILMSTSMILQETHVRLIGAISLHIAYCKLHLPLINKLFGFHDI